MPGGLADQVERDLAATLESDFGRAFTLKDPTGFAGNEQLFGRTVDIGQLIDLETGGAVAGRLGTVYVRRSSIVAAGYASMPRGESDATKLPWVVTFDSPGGQPVVSYKVAEARPDASMGYLMLVLVFYAEAA